MDWKVREVPVCILHRTRASTHSSAAPNTFIRILNASVIEFRTYFFQTGWYSEDEGLHLSSSIEGMKLNLFAGGGGRGGESLNDEADYAERARTNSLNNRAAYARSISQPVLSEVESLDEKDRYSRVPITRSSFST